MGNTKEINIKNRAYYFFDDMINIENFNPDLRKIDKKSNKNIDIYFVGHITRKDSKYVNVDEVDVTSLLMKQMDLLKKKIEINT